MSLTNWKVFHLGGKMDRDIWPDHYPPKERVGKSILLYYFPPEAFKTEINGQTQ